MKTDNATPTNREIANEIFADYIDRMLDGGIYTYQESKRVEFTDTKINKIEKILKRMAKSKLKSTGFTNERLD